MKNNKDEVQVWVADAHQKFINKQAFNIACQVMTDIKPNKIGWMGDETDYNGISSFSMKDYSYGVDECEAELLDFKNTTVKAVLEASGLYEEDMIFTLGNHNGERVDRLLNKLNDKRMYREAKDIERSLSFTKAFPRSKVLPYGIPYRKNGLNILHCEPGVGTDLHTKKTVTKFGQTVLYGHNHQQQVYTLSQRFKKPVRGISAPCMCNLAPAYGHNAGNQWSNGFVVVTFYNKTFNVEVVEIKNNKCIFRGKKYE